MGNPEASHLEGGKERMTASEEAARMTASEEATLRCAHLAMDDIPKTHTEHNRVIWEAFNLGRKYETEITKEKAESEKK